MKTNYTFEHNGETYQVMYCSSCVCIGKRCKEKGFEGLFEPVGELRGKYMNSTKEEIIKMYCL